VRDDGQQHDEADLRPGLEADADCQPIEEAVERQPERADQADVVVMSGRVVLLLAVDDRQLLEQEDRREAEDDGGGTPRRSTGRPMPP
jgi:hypothetical protein